MPTLYNYLDYRLFIKDFYEENKRKSSFFSYRYLGNKIGIDAGNIVKILQGKRHLSKNMVEKFVHFCKFTSKEAVYFRTRVMLIMEPSIRIRLKLMSRRTVISEPISCHSRHGGIRLWLGGYLIPMDW